MILTSVLSLIANKLISLEKPQHLFQLDGASQQLYFCKITDINNSAVEKIFMV